jgi:DNA-binding transcriptional ArsR family regulator
MVKYIGPSLDATFSALADPTRRAIVARLGEADPHHGVTVGELAEPFDVSLPAISKHLRVLERAGMLKQQRDGRIRRCRLEPEPIREVAQWIEYHKRFWNTQLDSLASFLESDDNTGFGFNDTAGEEGGRE